MPDEKTYLDKLLTRTPGFTYGDVLPFNQDEKGTTHLDLTAGIPGAAMQGWNTWSKLLQGKVAPYAIQDGPGDQSKAVINPDITQSAGALSMAAAAGSPLGTAPKGAARMFLGRNSSGADHAALGRAEQMAEGGLSKERIWSETGWFTGEDGHWRYEVPDHGATLNPVHAEHTGSLDYIPAEEGISQGWAGVGPSAEPTYLPKRKLQDAAGNEHYPVSEMLDHPALDKASGYPHWTEKPSGLESLPFNKSLLDWQLKPEHRPGVGGSADLWNEELTASRQQGPSFRNTILHELQHAAQKKEGFVNGGSSEQFLPADFAAQQSAAGAELIRSGKAAEAIYTQNGHAKGPDYKAAFDAFEAARQEHTRLGQMRQNAVAQYHNIPGEREARNVSKRSNMSNEELKQNPPWKTIDPYMKVN